MKKIYPPIKVKEKNTMYAKILLTSYAGNISEETAVHEYIYQHIILKNINKELSDSLLEISMTEMRHVSMIGELISLLGLKPKFHKFNFFTNNYDSWNTYTVNYETDVKKILLHNISMEEIAIKNYKKTINLINDKFIVNLINSIIEDEEDHLKIFKKFLNI